MTKRNQILSLFLCLILIAGSLNPIFAWATDDAILIEDLDDFLQFAENCRLDSYSKDKTFRLVADIDLSGSDFDGIPIFCGTFEGTHHTVSGLEITSAGDNKGLFRNVAAGASVMDLRVEGKVVPTGNREKVGGIAGVNAGTIKNCSFQGRVEASQYAGGISGINESSGMILGCSSNGTVSAYHFSGGITGSNQGTIRDCTNHAQVNTTAQQNSVDISDITLGNLTNTESAAATTDIGGVSGINAGVILHCSNRGNVGYKHMGYNVGGIAGMQTGYVADCENYGEISGRKEVGGIAGQQEPAVTIHYDTDTLQLLEVQLVILSDLIDRASANVNTNSANIRNLVYQMEQYIADAENALNYLNSALENPNWQDLQSYADALKTLQNSLEGVGSTMRQLRDAADETMTDLEADMAAIAAQMAVIESVLNSAEDHLGGNVFDDSDRDTASDVTSKVANCKNFGAILADLNAGGIVGAIVFENDLDPEEDISVVGDITLNAVGSLRSVITDCSNSAKVNAKNQHIGGIVGYMSLGLVRNCINTGAIENPSANYVGGIAGQASGYIRSCKTKTVISGAAYVGGIAGSATIVSDSYVMTHLQATQLYGSILGIAETPYSEVDDPITGNFYLQFGKDPGAIDGVSYSGKAQGLSKDEFFTVQANCPIFTTVTVTFLADDQIVYTEKLSAGASFSAIPEVPQKSGFVGRWDQLEETDLSCIFFDVTIKAAYVGYTLTVESDVTDDKGRPILLMQGDFSGAGKVLLTKMDSFVGLKEEQTFLQGWAFTAEDCIHQQAGRLLMPKDYAGKNLIVYVRDKNGDWNAIEHRIDGSYMVFLLRNGDDAIAVVEAPRQTIFTTEVLIAGATGAAVVLLFVAVSSVIRKQKRKHSTDHNG